MQINEDVVDRELERLTRIFFVQMSSCKQRGPDEEDSRQAKSPAAPGKTWPILTSYVNHQSLLRSPNLASAMPLQTLSGESSENIHETPHKAEADEYAGLGESYLLINSKIKSEGIIQPSTSSVLYPLKAELPEGLWAPEASLVNGNPDLTTLEPKDTKSTKSGSARRVCTYCGKSITKDNFMTHVRAMHSGETPFKCTYKFCTKQFPDKHRLRKHQLSHSVVYEFACKLCGSLAKRMFDLRKHIIRKHRAVIGEAADGTWTEYLNTFINRCKADGKESSDFCEFKDEISSQMEQVRSGHTESLSGNNTDMQNPISKITNTEYGLQLCEICGKTILHFNLRKHLDRHRQDKSYFDCHICPLCAHSFTDAYSFKRHIQHTHEKKFSLQCNICGQPARNKTELERHRIRKHEGQRNIPCPLCPKLFVLKDDVTVHIKTVHNPPELSECSICGQKSKQKRNLKVHLKRDHGLQDQSLQEFLTSESGGVSVQTSTLSLYQTTLKGHMVNHTTKTVHPNEQSQLH